MKAKILLAGLAAVLTTQAAMAERARFLVEDRVTIQARVDFIQQARQEILVEYFSVWNDDESVGGLALLVEAARRGVKVKVIMDSLSSKVPTQLLAALRSKGIGPDGANNLEFKMYNPASLNLKKITHRNHAKMIIVDGNILLTGGRNVGDKYFGVNTKRNFDDLDILLQGQVASEAKDNFMQVWNSKLAVVPNLIAHSDENIDPVSCAWKEAYETCMQIQEFARKQIAEESQRLEDNLQKILSQHGKQVVSHTNTDWMEHARTLNKVKFMSHKPDELVSPETAFLSHELLEILRSAKIDVNIVSPYLIPTPNTMAAFKELKERGVRVRVITNSLKSTDNLFAQAGYRFLKNQMVDLGIEIYEYEGPDTIHAKTAQIDFKHILIGTYNMDPRSSFINREVGIHILDDENTGLAEEQAAIIENFREKSILVAKDGVEYNKKWQNSDVSQAKKRMLNILLFTMPVLMNQL